jgi:hypothetical protein
MAFAMAGTFLAGTAALDIKTGTMNPPREDQGAGQETVRAESEGGSTPPIQLKLGYQQFGRSCSIGVSPVHKYLKRAEAAGLTWPLPEDWTGVPAAGDQHCRI